MSEKKGQDACPSVSGIALGGITLLWIILILINGSVLILSTLTSETFINYDSSYLHNDFNLG